jgi:hypothetical protein
MDIEILDDSIAEDVNTCNEKCGNMELQTVLEKVQWQIGKYSIHLHEYQTHLLPLQVKQIDP